MAGSGTLSTSAFCLQPLAFGPSGAIQVLGSATIGGNLTIGLLTINDMDASIDSMGETLKLCIEDVCVTRDELERLLERN